jgi:chromosome partitioning protein
METRIIAIINQKGGTAKTTTAVNLSSALATKGKKILLIDFDPQGNATSNVGIEKHNESFSIYDPLINKKDINDAILKTEFGLDIIKSNITLAKGEQELSFQTTRELKLKMAIAKIKNKYDYIIIDCPPSLGLLTINALSASTDVIVPIETAEFSLEGISDLFDTIDIVQNEVNPELNIMGILLTKYDSRTKMSKRILDQLKGKIGAMVFDTIIKVNIKISEAQYENKPVDHYEKNCSGTENYRELVEEVLKR